MSVFNDQPPPEPIFDGTPADPSLDRVGFFLVARRYPTVYAARAEYGERPYTERFAGPARRYTGSDLGHVFNPVSVDGQRAWAVWSAGGYAIYEEVFESERFADFVVSHFSPYVQMLHRLHRARDKFSGGIDTKSIFTFALAVRKEAGAPKPMPILMRMADLCWRDEQIQRTLGDDPLTDIDAVCDKLRTVDPAPMDGRHHAAAVKRLLRVATKRFAHL